jgi:hypothetical protein
VLSNLDPLHQYGIDAVMEALEVVGLEMLDPWRWVWGCGGGERRGGNVCVGVYIVWHGAWRYKLSISTVWSCKNWPNQRSCQTNEVANLLLMRTIVFWQTILQYDLLPNHPNIV